MNDRLAEGRKGRGLSSLKEWVQPGRHGAHAGGPWAGEWSLNAPYPSVCCLPPSLVPSGSKPFHVYPGSEGVIRTKKSEVCATQDWAFGVQGGTPNSSCDLRWRMTKPD